MGRVRIIGVLGVWTFVWSQGQAQAAPVGSAFTYQGQLKQGGAPVSGTADLYFSLWDAQIDGVLIDERITEAVDVTNGLFTVSLDFGSDLFTGNAYWLEVAVRFPAGVGEYVLLTPRQRLTPTPYALALPGLRTQQNNTSPNLIGGWNSNTVTDGIVGATIGGGGAQISGSLPNRVTDDYGTVGGGVNNLTGNDDEHASDAGFATVGGGHSNQATNWAATVAGGHRGMASGQYSAVGGGTYNVAIAESATVSGGNANSASGRAAAVGGGTLNAAMHQEATVGGGYNNLASADWATVGGGFGNQAKGTYAVVPGGTLNVAGGDFSLAAGQRAIVRDPDATSDAGGDEGTFVWADSMDADFASTGPNQFLIRASGGVGIGTNEPTNALSVAGNADLRGLVGIGTVTPMANLDIVSENPLSTTINVVNTSSAQRFLFQVNGNNPGGQDREGNLEIVGYGARSIYNVLTATPDGKVGINTFAPSNALSVGGVADFGGSVGIGTATPTANLDIVSANPTATGINIKNAASAQRFLFQVNGSAPGGENRQGNLEIWGTGVGGNHNVLTATTDGNVGIGTSNPSNVLSVVGTADFSEKVGIGTKSPGYMVPSSKLEVSGGHIAVSNNYGVFSCNAAGDAIGAGFDTGNDDTLDLYAGGGRKLRIKPDGTVGIGTDTPASSLSVSGDADFSEKIRIGTTPLGYTLTNTGLEVSQGNIMLGNGGGIVSVNSAGTGIGAGFRTGTSGDLYLYGNGAVRVHLAPDGNVGIGSSPPSERLTVGGIVKSTTGGFKFPDGTVLTSADGANIWSKNGTSAYYNGGNVGIGTSSPQDKIDILNGNITMDTGPSGSSAVRFRHDGNLRWTFLYRSWATNEFGLYNESAGKWGMTFTTDTNRMGIGRTSPEHPLQVGTDATNGNGAHLTAGGIWTNGSDRNSKEAFEAIDKRAILAKVADLPVTSWRYKSEDEGTRHIGPTAQDFHAAFGLGSSEKHIGTLDADGVALTAIQGLYELVQEKDAQVAAQKEQIATLTARLECIEAMLKQQCGQ